MWTGERIKELRKQYDETGEEFCKRLRVSIHALRFWEQDKGKPSPPIEELFDRLEQDLREGRVKQMA